MPYKTLATLTSKGQITLPVELRRLWDLKVGDQLAFSFEETGQVVLSKRGRRSILTSREELAPLSLGRRLRQADIDHAVTAAMGAQELRSRGRSSRR
jgi:bifunctional DNA-binding transcriptional regulator/antitoxin component of YhaV-PrlF toxin-antitoxin module